MAGKLSEQEIAQRTGALTGWIIRDGKLYRECGFANSERTFAFMTHVTRLSQMMNHRPELTNAHNKVKMSLSTPTAGGITELDVQLAEKINEIVAHQGGR